MAMYDLDLLANDDVTKHREKGEHGGHSCRTIDDEKWYMIDFKAIGKISYAGSTLVSVCNDDNFMAAINQFLENTS
jgi:hypothetical protein